MVEYETKFFGRFKMGELGTGFGFYGVSLDCSQSDKGRTTEKVEVYDHQGILVSVDTLKRHDLLVVYFKAPLSAGSMSTEAILATNIQGTVVYSTLIDFEQLSKHGLEGIQASWYTGLNKPLVFPWNKIEKIHMAGHDSSGRVMMFVEELFRQKAKVEKAAEQMRENIDALKA